MDRSTRVATTPLWEPLGAVLRAVLCVLFMQRQVHRPRRRSSQKTASDIVYNKYACMYSTHKKRVVASVYAPQTQR